MAQVPGVPKNSLKISTFDEFSEFVGKFVTGNLRLLMIVGGPGVAKTQTVRRAVGNRQHLLIDTHATAFGMYHKLYEHRGRPVIIDDLDHIYGDRACVRLLKSLCNTDAVKNLSWPTRHPDIVGGTVPSSFTTTSSVCLITNEWRTVNSNVEAIEDRATIVHFAPSAGELHAKVREWFHDEEVYHYIEEFLPLINRPSMRHYIKGSELREACPEKWREWLLTIMGLDEKVLAIHSLLSDARYSNETDRATAFEASGYGSRATYYRWKNRFETILTLKTVK